MHPALNIAVPLLRKASDRLLQIYHQTQAQNGLRQAEPTFNTELKRTVHAQLQRQLKSFYPHGAYNPSEIMPGSTAWFINLLEDDINFTRSGSGFGLSAAFVQKGLPEVAAVYFPEKQSLVTAVRGQGAKIETYRLKKIGSGSDLTILSLDEKIFQPKGWALSSEVQCFLNRFKHWRLSGSLLTELISVALGQSDALIHSPWSSPEHTAHQLIAQEAGLLTKPLSKLQPNLAITASTQALARCIK